MQRKRHDTFKKEIIFLAKELHLNSKFESNVFFFFSSSSSPSKCEIISPLPIQLTQYHARLPPFSLLFPPSSFIFFLQETFTLPTCTHILKSSSFSGNKRGR